MTYFNQAARFFGGSSGYVKNAVAFDGSTDAVAYSGSAVDSSKKTFTLSAYLYKTNGGAGVENIIHLGDSSGTTRLHVQNANGSNNTTINVYALSTSDTGILSAAITTGVGLNEWFHLAISIDLSSTSKRHVYINGASASTTWSTYTNSNINFAGATKLGVGAISIADSEFYSGDMGDFYFDTTYTDLSANIGNFYSATMKKPPAGGKVVLYGATDTWHENKGTLTGFTEVGTLSTSTHLPVSI